jgi:glycosyltransferase involved in cell wall biosynthesis
MALEKNPMRIAIIAPYSTGTMRGNITTVRRISRSFSGAGVEHIVLPMDAFEPEEIERRIRLFSPDLIHAFHAFYCGETACSLAQRLKIPCVVTLIGSDINDPLFRDHGSTGCSVAMAAAVTCFDQAEADMAARYFPHRASRLAVIPQGVEVLAPCAWPEIPDSAFVVLLPAALRPVKNVEFPLRALAPLCEMVKGLQLVIAGGVINQEYAAGIRCMLADAPFARWFGEVPYERMGGLYARADVVLNCSRFEGMPNSLLEAIALGRPVLVADIPGNRSLVRHGETGWLYKDEVDFRATIVRLAGDPGLRKTVGGHARDFVQADFSCRLEVERYLSLYESVIRATFSLDKKYDKAVRPCNLL